MTTTVGIPNVFNTSTTPDMYWPAGIVAKDPDFLNRLANEQKPLILWIDCSDSRVPEVPITHAPPGTISTLSNIANQYHLRQNDTSALDYAVNDLGVRHIAVVGHSECGGCEAASLQPKSAIDIPLVGDLKRADESVDPECERDTADTTAVIEKNVKRQIDDLCETPTVQSAWKEPLSLPVFVHGWFLKGINGELEDMNITRGPPDS